MLQQTQVVTVIPYWERWLRALPTIQSLADADTHTIHKLWEGLGYYTRVRNMQKAAQQIVAQHGGKFPRSHAEILELPGIGPYTAGAIASIAFNQPQPILDGNVIRVLTRLFAIAENPRDKITNEKLWNIASELVTTAARLPLQTSNSKLLTSTHKLQTSSALNQSLMELGALICTPKQPQCPRCPLQSNCRAHKLRSSEKFPNLGPRPAATQQHHIAFVIQHSGQFLVRQRVAGKVNAHLWEFPNVPSKNPSDKLPPQKMISLVRETLGLDVKNPAHLCTIKHTITRYRITLDVFRMTAARPKKIPPATAKKFGGEKISWLPLTELDRLPFTSAHRKILRKLTEGINRQ